VQRFVVHLFISVAVCGFVVGTWALTSGSFAELSDIAGNPTLARKLGFWPIWVILGGAAALLVHLGFVVAGLFGNRARRRRRRAARQAQRAGKEVGDALAEMLRSLAARRRERKPAATRGPVKRWVAVMFSDIVDSTRLAEEVGDEEWTGVVVRYRDGWVYSRTSSTVATTATSWKRTFQLDEMGGDAAHSYKFVPIASRGAVEVTYTLDGAFPLRFVVRVR